MTIFLSGRRKLLNLTNYLTNESITTNTTQKILKKCWTKYFSTVGTGKFEGTTKPRQNVVEYVKFEKMLAQRRNEAARSIIVQVHSELSCSELYNFCHKLAPVLKMFHYKVKKNHFVLVELSENVLDSVLPKCAHSVSTKESTDIRIPVISPVLWFKAKGKTVNALTSPTKTNDNLPLSYSSPVEWETVLEWISAAESISDEMKILYESTKLDELGYRLRFITARQLELALLGIFPNCAALPFGSSLNGFGKNGCDLDVVFQHSYVLPDNLKMASEDSRLVFQCKVNSGGSRIHTQRQMELLADIVQVYLPGCAAVKRILQARVPIVKYTNEMSGLECDISMTNMTGVYMSEILYLMGSLQPELSKHLVFTVKHWARVVGLTNPTPGRWITNFTLTILCLFYLQVRNILPSLDVLRKAASKEDERFTEDINCTFCRDLNKFEWAANDTKMDPPSLLKGFFEYYTEFDFSTLGISLSTGTPFSKPDYSPMYIANPLEKGLNVSKNVSAEEVERLRIAFRNAAWILETCDSLLPLFKDQNKENLSHLIKRDRRYIPNRMFTVKDLFTDG